MPSDEGTQATYHYDLFADYHQIYLEDCQIQIGENKDDLERAREIHAFAARLLTKEAFARHLAVEPGVVCMLTARDMTVPVEIEIRNDPPNDDFALWDHIVEASIETLSGCLVILGCTDYLPDASHIQVKPGVYRVRVYFGGVYTLSADRLDGEDHYRVVLWPAPYSKPEVLYSNGKGEW